MKQDEIKPGSVQRWIKTTVDRCETGSSDPMDAQLENALIERMR